MIRGAITEIQILWVTSRYAAWHIIPTCGVGDIILILHQIACRWCLCIPLVMLLVKISRSVNVLQGAQADTKQLSMRTNRETNPINPVYVALDGKRTQFFHKY